MFKFIKTWFNGETDMKYATIKAIGEGAALVDRHGNTIGMYSRKRDAVRGAKRRGLTVM